MRHELTNDMDKLADIWAEACLELLAQAESRPYMGDVTMWDAFRLIYARHTGEILGESKYKHRKILSKAEKKVLGINTEEE